MRALAVLAVATIASGCIKSYATGAIADALSGSGGAYGKDDDPELIEQAVPFGLKTMESVLVEQPKHRGLLTALASGFTSYAVAFVDMPADQIAAEDFEKAQPMKARARKLFLRARGYALRGMEVEHEKFASRLAKNPDQALKKTTKEDVPLLYWTAASWGLLISSSKEDAAMIADIPLVERLAERALELDPDWNNGAIHELFISLEAARPAGSAKKSREHFDKAIALSQGKKASPYVSLAESVSVKEQNLKEFNALLDKALAVDLEASPDDRLTNVIMQRRATWLKSRASDLFLDAGEEGLETETSTTP